MIAIRGTIQASTEPRKIWVYKLSNITDNLSTSQTDYAVYIEKTLNSFKEPIADIDPDRKYTIEKSQLKDLSTVSHLNNFSKDVPGGQGITLANGFVFFVYENIENLGSNLYKSTLTTRVFTYAGTQIGSGFDLVFDSSTPNNIGSILNIGDGYKFNGYVEAEGIRYRNGKVYIFAKVRFNKKDGKLNNLRTAYIFEIDITQ